MSNLDAVIKLDVQTLTSCRLREAHVLIKHIYITAEINYEMMIFSAVQTVHFGTSEFGFLLVLPPAVMEEWKQ